jgi:hypothetical protein
MAFKRPEARFSLLDKQGKQIGNTYSLPEAETKQPESKPEESKTTGGISSGLRWGSSAIGW